MKKHKTRLQRFLSKFKLSTAASFAVIFGIIGIALGLSQIFALNPVALLFSPTTQTANAGETKTVTIMLNNYAQQVDGGSIAVTYDPALLEIASFVEPSNPIVVTSNKSSTSGRYAYDFVINGATPANPDLGKISFKAKSSSTTQNAFIRFDGASTKAYNGPTATGRTYYPIGYGQAVITINPAPASTPPPAQTPAPTPPPSQTPTPTSGPSNPRPAPQPSTQPNTNSGDTPISTSNDNTNTINGPSATDPYGYTQDGLYFDDGNMQQDRKGRLSPLLIIGGGIFLIGSGAIIFSKLKQRPKYPHHHTDKDLHTGKPTKATDDPPLLDEENVVVKPEHTQSREMPKANAASEHEYPAIITTHIPGHHNPPQPPVPESHSKPQPHPESEEPSKPAKPTEQTITKVKETTDKAHHKEVEVDIVRVKPEEQIPTSPANASVAYAKPLVTDTADIPRAPSTHSTNKPVHNIPVPQPQASHQSHGSLANKPAAPMHHVPAWQEHLAAQSQHSKISDEPPDMFELASEHPETFGSYQAMEAEDSGPSPKKESK